MKIVKISLIAVLIMAITFFIMQSHKQAQLNVERALAMNSILESGKILYIDLFKHNGSFQFSDLDNSVKEQLLNKLNDSINTPVYMKKEIVIEPEKPEIFIISKRKYYDSQSGLFSLKKSVYIILNSDGTTSLISEDKFNKIKLEKYLKID